MLYLDSEYEIVLTVKEGIKTTNFKIDNIFGDLIKDNKKDKLSQEEFDDILDRCNIKSWDKWALAWDKWRNEGVI